jgi:hypothetical protein
VSAPERPEHPVAGHHEGDRVLAHRGAHRPAGRGLADAARDVGIGGGAPERDAQQRLPDPHLEIGADEHHPQGLLGLPAGGVEHPPGERRGRGFVLPVIRLRPAPPHIGERRGPVAVVHEADAGEAPVGGDQDRLAERGGVVAVESVSPAPPAL